MSIVKTASDKSIAEIVSAEKIDAISSGIVKDDETQSLSVLAEPEDALGERQRRMGRTSKEGPPAVAAKSSAAAVPEDMPASSEVGHIADSEKAASPLKAKQLALSALVDKLDEADEFEGTRDAYDTARNMRFASRTMRYRKAKSAAQSIARAQKLSSKATGALGAGKGSSTTAATAQCTPQMPIQRLKVITGTTAKTSANATIAVSVGGSGAATIAGVFCGILAFVLISLIVGQVLSALFGFWDAEDKKRSLEGLPSYITYEMVEEAICCQEEYGHPAGCTIAQIICESGQGDAMSLLATRDHNLFGMKWSASFASAPEVIGKAAWKTNEEYTPGAITTITDYFTVFKGDVECIRFRSRVFLQAPHYKNNPLIRQAIVERSSDKMAEGLKASGWATSPAYDESLKGALDAYNLRRFDAMSLDDFRSIGLSKDVIVAAAESQLGVPYVWGGTTPDIGLDCSGLTRYCYAKAGISIPREADDQAAYGRKVPVSEAVPGDILWRPGHVAIYIGDDRYIHAPRSGAYCTIGKGASSFASAIKIR